MIENFDPGSPCLDMPEEYGPHLQPLIAAARAGEPLEPVMTSIVRALGFDSFIFAMASDPLPDHESRIYAWTTLPAAWVAQYDKNAYMEVDPRVTMSSTRTRPLIWDAASINGDDRVRTFLSHAAQFGIRSGVTVSFSDARHPRFGASFNSSISPVGPERYRMILGLLGDLMLVTAGFHDIFLAGYILRGFPPSLRGMPLSPREEQCLQLAARGMTSADIGIKLGIAERTANFHFGNILTKLDALNRHEAIAKGMKRGIIQMDY